MNKDNRQRSFHLAPSASAILELLPESLGKLTEMVSRWHAYDLDETLRVASDKAREVSDELIDRLRDNYPFFHPSYAGQMLKPPHPIAALAYFLAMQINPNNHTLDGGPATAKMETGLGAILRKTRKAALEWASLIEASDELRLILQPSLDIINYYAVTKGLRVSEISALTHRVFDALMNTAAHPVYLAKLIAKPNLLAKHSDLIWDAPLMTVFRSVLMRPEQLEYAPVLHKRVLDELSRA